MSLRLEVGWDRTATTGDTEHWLMVTLRGFEGAVAPASYAILIDTSTSMLGSRLAHARTAVAGLVRSCRSTDRLVVYAFGSAVTPVLVTPGGADVAPDLSVLTASGKTRLDLAIKACTTWICGRSGPRHIVVLTDGDPTDAEGRRTPVDSILSQARALGATGVRTSVIGIGSAEGYDGSFLRSLADAGGGPSAVGVDPSSLADRVLSELRSGGADEVDLMITLDSEVLEIEEAWRVSPRVQPLTAVNRRVAVPAGEGAVVGFRLRYRAPLAAAQGPRAVGVLRVQTAAGAEVNAQLTLTVVPPRSSELARLDVGVDQLRVRVELARIAQLRSTADATDEQLKHTRRLSDLVKALGDHQATARIDEQLRQLVTGVPLDRGEREQMVDLLRNGRRDA